MASPMDHGPLQIVWVLILAALTTGARGIDIFLEWNVALDWSIRPINVEQPVITINGMFPGPLLNATTNDNVYVNVFNNMDEPFLLTWNGIQQRLNSWQDGVSGTNCPIQPGSNWTYAFQTKDQIGSFFYFPTTGFQKAAGGFGPIRVNNRNVILVPFPKPEAEFDVLIGDWSSFPYKRSRAIALKKPYGLEFPDSILINGKAPYNNSWGGSFESFTVTKGKTYRLRISNVGSSLSLNFRIQNHQMVLVESEGSYTAQITLDSLDVHVGQCYSVLVTANQNDADYYIVATPTQVDSSGYPDTVGVAVLHYSNSNTPPSGPKPQGPDQMDREFSINQARSIRWNMTAGAARPNPQGTFNVTKVAINQTFILHGSTAQIMGRPRYNVNNVSYLTPTTTLKLADYLVNGSGVYQLDAFPVDSINQQAAYGTSVVTGIHKGWIEIVFKNDHDAMDTWHLDGFGFYVVGFGNGDWTPDSREFYNLNDPVVRSTVQVYPGEWSAIFAYLDNPGMWNLRSQRLENWYLGQEMYLRVHDNDPDPAKERPPPQNLLLCGIFGSGSDNAPAPTVGSPPAPSPQVLNSPVESPRPPASSPQVSNSPVESPPAPSPQVLNSPVESPRPPPASSPQVSNSPVESPPPPAPSPQVLNSPVEYPRPPASSPQVSNSPVESPPAAPSPQVSNSPVESPPPPAPSPQVLNSLTVGSPPAPSPQVPWWTNISPAPAPSPQASW